MKKSLLIISSAVIFTTSASMLSGCDMNRTQTGGVIGGGAGAGIGAALGGTGGAIIGGALGAGVGSQVGKKSR